MGETNSYFPYHQPIHTDLVKFGHLAFKYRNPQNPPRYRHDEDIPTLGKMTVQDLRPIVLLSHRDDTGINFAGGLEGILQLSSGVSLKNQSFVIGTDGSQTELKEPEEFFENIVLPSPAARKWFKSRLAVANKLQLLKNYLGMKPKLWMLVGTLTIKDAVYFTASSYSQKTAVDVSIPVTDPSGISTLMNLKVGAKASIGGGLIMECGGRFAGSMIWAAKWQRVGTKYFQEAETEDNLSKSVRLLDIVSTLGYRDDEEDEQGVYAGMSVTDELSTFRDEEDDGDLPKEYWERFEAEVDALDDEEDEDTGVE